MLFMKSLPLQLKVFRAFKHFKSLGDDIDKLDKQLVSGRGNLCGKFESLKNFGATPKKNLPNVEGE